MISFLKIIIAQRATVKTTTQRSFRKRSPTQHALFLQRLTAEAVDNPSPSTDMQTEFDLFYTKVLYLLNCFYPLRTYRGGKIGGEQQTLS